MSLLDIHEHGDVLELRLARPPVNALDPGLVRRLIEAIDEHADARALVLSGSPGIFSAGLDVPVLLGLERPAMRAFLSDFYGVMHKIASSPTPIVTAMTGHSPAGGAVLALFSDYRVAAEGDFRIGLNEVQVGLPVSPMICHALARLVGARRAEQMLVTATLVDGPTALDIGLVDALVPIEEVIPTALERARLMASMPRRAFTRTRANARAALIDGIEEVDESMLDGLTNGWFSDETQTAMRALVASIAARRS